MDTTEKSLARVIGALDDAAVQIRELEREAEVLLHQNGDPDGSAENMRRKAEILRDLPDALDGLLEPLGAELCETVEAKCDNLSQRAGAALAQGSLFWMRNLLYPDDYQDGQPNELELFIAQLAHR